MCKEEVFKIGLPKWTQCVINGDKITEEQALEIIRRTDSFFFGFDGNNKKFNEIAERICRRPNYHDFEDDWNNMLKQEMNLKRIGGWWRPTILIMIGLVVAGLVGIMGGVILMEL